MKIQKNLTVPLEKETMQNKIQLFKKISKQKPSKETLIKIREDLLGKDDNTFPTFLKKKIQELDLRQLDVARMCCVDAKTISKWCSGRGLPDIKTIPILAKVLNVSTHTIMNIIFEIRDTYTIQELESYIFGRSRLDIDLAEKDEWELRCIIGDSLYNLYLHIKHIYNANGATYSMQGFINSEQYKELIHVKKFHCQLKMLVWLKHMNDYDWEDEKRKENKK